MDTLFSEEELDNGFRLEYFEVYNWGGFHNRIWRIDPQCDSILITGANGSGKTTLADALVSLLVPPSRRHYNQSSGSERKRDRTEESYVLGAYGALRDEEAGRSSVSNLRDKSCYSILLAVFRNKRNQSVFSLAQLRWFTASGLQREYITADATLSIREHFLPLDAKREYRKRLSHMPGITWHESFSKYQQYLIRSLGLRSEKALNLFSQIVGVKQIENLNGFIRTHMLEEPGMEEDFHKLKSNYHDLLQTHNKIEMAEKQLEFLTAVSETGGAYRLVMKETETLHTIKEAIPFFFALRIQKAAEDIHTTESVKLETLYAEKQKLERDQKDLELNLDSLNAAIARDSTSARLREIEKDLVVRQSRMQECKQRYSRYIRNSDALELPIPVSSQIFNENRRAATELIVNMREKQEEREVELRRTERQKEDQKEAAAELETEINSLRKRASNIPFKNLRLRKQLCDALELDVLRLPFAGELIQVKSEEGRWELAAEKLLHNLALSILIPEELYKKATTYINATDLKGRLVYYRIRENDFANNTDEGLFRAGPAALPSKIEIRPNTPFSSWLTSTLLDRFNYLCTDDLEEFSRAPYAVTSRGLIKGKYRHEKDDRPGRWGRDRYVLGWDNSRKIAYLAEEQKKIDVSLSQLRERIENFRRQIDDQRAKIELGNSLVFYENFEEIDWAAWAKGINELEDQKRALLESADDLKKLEEEKAVLLSDRNILNQNNEQLIGEMTLCKQKVDAMAAQVRASGEILDPLDEQQRLELAAHTSDIEKLVREQKSGGTDSIEILKNQQAITLQQVATKMEEMAKKRDKAGRDLTNAMNRFLAPGTEVARNFPGWSSETLHLSASPEFLDDYLALYDQITKDDLPQYKNDFRKFMNERMSENIISFENTLDSTYRKIREDIKQLNRSLKAVTYSRRPETYITLDSRTTRDIAIQDFRALLNKSIGDLGKIGRDGKEAADELEASFSRMQELINRLSEDDNWRKKVLDVRNWLEFAAVECYRENDEQKQYYEDSMSLSGGEKAKLAYTILASAIAYQYGLNREQYETSSRSFRFIIVDEIFSKVDPVNSEYAMELFKAMGLQLMIITPLDRINIVEKHIGSVCFIEKQGEYAVPHALSLEDYHELQVSTV
jgi:uncharacterized protein YPO0396